MKTHKSIRMKMLTAIVGVLVLCFLTTSTLLAQETPKLFKGVIGVHSTMTDGASSISDYCAQAKKQGLDYIVFTEKYEMMNKEKWAELIKLCDKQSTGDFKAFPGLDMPSLVAGKTLRSIAIAPKQFPTDTAFISILFGFGSNNRFNPIVANPATQPVNIWKLAFWHGMEVYTYDGEGNVIADSYSLYKDMVTNRRYFFPITGHRIYRADELASIDGTLLTYFRGTIFGDQFMSNGPIIDKFGINDGSWFDMGEGDRKKISFSASSDSPIREIILYKDYDVFRRYKPNAKTFEDEIFWYPAESARFFLEVTDEAGNKAISGYIYFQSYPFTNVMCSDNQNNIPVWMLGKEYKNDIINFGAAHTSGHIVRYFTARPTNELVPPGQETGVAGAIYSFDATHSFNEMTDWTGYDTLAFDMKSDTVGTNVGPRFMNDNEWPTGALTVEAKDTKWNHYTIDISNIPRYDVQAFLVYIPSTTKVFNVWLDDFKLVNSKTGRQRVIDDFEQGVDEWTTGAPDNYITQSDDAKQGRYSLRNEVKRLQPVGSNGIQFNGLRGRSDVKFKMTLSGRECAQWVYTEETPSRVTDSTYTLFLPPVYGYNAPYIAVKTTFKETSQLPAAPSPEKGRLGFRISGAGIQGTLGEWPNYAYLNPAGKFITGSFNGNALKAIPILEKGFFGAYPNEFGAYAYFPMDDKAYAIDAKQGVLTLGLADRPNKYVKGGVFDTKFTFLLGSGSKYMDQPDNFRSFYDDYGFDGTPAYTVDVTKGALIDDVYVLKLKAQDYEAQAELGKAKLVNNLPVIVEGLNDNWDAFAINAGDREFKRVPVLDGKAYAVFDLSTASRITVGNLLMCDNEDVVIDIVETEGGRILVQCHNPTDEEVQTTITSAPSLKPLYDVHKEITIAPYETVRFSIK